MTPPGRAASPPPPRSPFQRRLFWGIYGHGLLMLALVALTVGGLGWALRDHPPAHRKPRHLARLLLQELAEPDPVQRAAKAAELSDLLNLDLAVFDAAGQRLAEAGDRPPPPLTPAERARLRALPPGVPLLLDGRRHQAVRLGPDGAWAVTHWRGPGGARFLAAVVAVLAVLALVSWPRARGIARPVERTIETTARWARGDLTPRIGLRRGPADLVAMATALDEMAERLQAHRGRERALLADVSHELRTPLARIRVALEWAEEEKALPAPLAGVGADLAELERLVDDVLMASRLETGEAMVLRPQATTLAAVVNAAVARFGERHPQAEVTVRCPPVPLAADPALLRRALENVLENAVRHGQPPVHVAAEVLSAAGGSAGAGAGAGSAPGTGALVRLTVRDTGAGVPPEALAHLFDPFYRVDASRTRHSGGVGLGLALVRKIVEAHGGRVEAELPAEGGLQVSLSLPVQGPHA